MRKASLRYLAREFAWRLKPVIRPVIDRIPLPAFAAEVAIGIELVPPNGSMRRPGLVRCSRRLVARRPCVSTALLAARVIAEQRRAGLTGDELLTIVREAMSDPTLDSASQIAAVLRLLDELVEDGDVALAERLSEHTDEWVVARAATQVAHALACRRFDHREASRLMGILTAETGADALDGPLARHRAAFDSTDSWPWSAHDGDRAGSAGSVPAACDQLEASVLRNDVELATQIAERELYRAHLDLRLLRLTRVVLEHPGNRSGEQLVAAVDGDPSLDVNAKVRAFNELLRPDLAIAAGQRGGVGRLGPHGIYALAQAHYAQRDFSETLSALERLAGSARHADALKLTSRVLFEQGDFERALHHRRRHAVPSLHLDEVLFHCRLYEGTYTDAFKHYCPPGDIVAAEVAYGRQRAQPIADSDACFVIAQSGPGDEIQMAMAYASLSHVASAVGCTVDPRLLRLFERSFPSIRFVPTRRLSQPLTWGFLQPGSPDRVDGSLGRLLDRRAADIITDAHCLRYARELPAALHLVDTPPRSVAYLRPDPERLGSVAPVFAEPRPVVGVVWRSEMRTLMRSIHYLQPHDLEAIFELDVNVVNLQHDASPDERSWLEQRLGNRVRFADDLDLRDDLDSAASLLAELDVVVGVGTTLTELAGAIGTPTVLLQPNHFGTWRAVNDECDDFWYRSTRVAARFGARSGEGYIDVAARLVAEELTGRAERG